MARATATKQDAPADLTALLAAQAADTERLREVEAELHRVFLATSPQRVGLTTASRGEQYRMLAAEPALRMEALQLEGAIEDRRAAIAAAKVAARKREQAAAVEALRPLVPRLDKALGAVEECLREMVGLSQAAAGGAPGAGAVDGLLFLLDDIGPAAVREGRISAWRREMRARGLLGE